MENKHKEKLTIEKLIETINEEINGILRANLYEIGLNDEELKRLRIRKRELRSALKNCGVGDIYSKEYIKAAIKNILLDKLHISEDDISDIICFNKLSKLSIKDKFDIVLFQYKKKYK